MTGYLSSARSPRAAAPLPWTLLATLGRASPGSVDVEVLARVAADPALDLTLIHDGWSLLGAALVGWGSGQIKTVRTQERPPLISAAVPGEPVSALPITPETAALILLHRGLDPFEQWDQVIQGLTPLTLGAPPMHALDLEPMKCPWGLALKMGLDSVVATSLRLPHAPLAATFNALRVNDQPLLHALLEHRPRLIEPLLAHGLDPNVRDVHERTPLFMARTAEQVTQLCAAGADPHALDRQGRPIERWWQEQQVPRHTDLTRALTRVRAEQGVKAPVLKNGAALALKGAFQHAWEGNRLAICKGPEGADLGTTPAPGFEQPISAISCALLGALTTTEANAGKDQHIAVVKHLWRAERAGPLEHLLLQWVLRLRPVEAPVGYRSQAQRAQDENRATLAQWVRDTVNTHGRVLAPKDHQPWLSQVQTFMEAQDPTGDCVKRVTTRMLKHVAQDMGRSAPQACVDMHGFHPATWQWAARCATSAFEAPPNLWTPVMEEWRTARTVLGRASRPRPTAEEGWAWPALMTASPLAQMHVWQVLLTRDNAAFSDVEHHTVQALLRQAPAWMAAMTSELERATLKDLDQRVDRQAPPWATSWTALRRSQLTHAQGAPSQPRRRLRS